MIFLSPKSIQQLSNEEAASVVTLFREHFPRLFEGQNLELVNAEIKDSTEVQDQAEGPISDPTRIKAWASKVGDKPEVWRYLSMGDKGICFVRRSHDGVWVETSATREYLSTGQTKYHYQVDPVPLLIELVEQLISGTQLRKEWDKFYKQIEEDMESLLRLFSQGPDQCEIRGNSTVSHSAGILKEKIVNALRNLGAADRRVVAFREWATAVLRAKDTGASDQDYMKRIERRFERSGAWRDWAIDLVCWIAEAPPEISEGSVEKGISQFSNSKLRELIETALKKENRMRKQKQNRVSLILGDLKNLLRSHENL